DQAEAGAAVHDHHRKFGAAPFDAMHVGDLRPRELAVQRIEPGERHLRACDGNALPPRRAVAGLVEDAHHDVLVAAFLVAVIGIEREREMMDGVREETDTLPTWTDGSAPSARPPVPAALIVDRTAGDRRLLPTRITF